MKPRQRLTAGARLLIASMTLAPAVIAFGTWLTAGSPILGGLAIGYGCIFGIVGVFVGASKTCDYGLTTDEPSYSMLARDLKNAQRQLEALENINERLTAGLIEGHK